MLITVGTKPQETIVALHKPALLSKTEENAVHFKESEYLWTQIERNQQVSKKDESRNTHDWWQEIQIGDFTRIMINSLKIMEIFETIWDDQMHRQASDIINFRTRNRVPCVAYRPVPKAQGFKKSENHKMLVMEEIQPAETEWAASIVFATKKKAHLHFMWAA